MNRGGARPGAGRKAGTPKTGGRMKGAKNKRAVDRERRIQEAAAAIESALPEAFKGDAHAFLMAVYKDTSLPIKDRLAAATAAIGYEKPKLAAVEVQADIDAAVAVTRIEIVSGVPRADELEQLERNASGVGLHH